MTEGEAGKKEFYFLEKFEILSFLLLFTPFYIRFPFKTQDSIWLPFSFLSIKYLHHLRAGPFR